MQSSKSILALVLAHDNDHYRMPKLSRGSKTEQVPMWHSPLINKVTVTPFVPLHFPKRM